MRFLTRQSADGTTSNDAGHQKSLRNIGDLGRSRRSFGLDAFTEGLIDELGKYILGLDRGFEARLERL